MRGVTGPVVSSTLSRDEGTTPAPSKRVQPDKLVIAAQLREIGALLSILGENRFRARAYQRGAEALEGSKDELGALIEARRLTSLSGIGPALAAVIEELARTGRADVLDELRALSPPGMIELSDVAGMTETRIRALHAALGISSIAALKAACEQGRVRTVKGFGAKTEARLLEAIADYERGDERLLLVDALALAEPLLSFVRLHDDVERAEIVGAIRRRMETIGDVDLLASTRRPRAVLDHFVDALRVARVEEKTASHARVRLAGGARAKLHLVSPPTFASALVQHTGSRSHVEHLSTIAHEKKIDFASLTVDGEAEVYARLGLPFIPPELREDDGELEAALGGESWDDLVTRQDVRGAVHCHTVFSDGKNTIEEMARGAEELGLEYLTITDHSPTAHYAGGVTLDRLKEQWDEIARVQASSKVKILRGTESDILDDGALDYPDAILERFDVIIASVHSKMKMDAETMTRRLIRAMKQPVFKIWGHALGRLIQRRPPYACDVEAVLDAVAESRAAIEVNGDPYRLDLPPPWIKRARLRKIPFVISTDAHSVKGMRSLAFGVSMARRGGLRKHEVLNTRSADAFARAVHP